MFTVSDDARKELDAYFADKEKAGIRVYLAPGGCCGPRMGLALDEAGDGDEVFNEAGYTFCIEKELYQKVQGVSIEFGYMGFVVTPEVPLPQQGGGCAGCGSAQGGGCGSAGSCDA